jgi:voltage-gated potassium channel
MMHRKKIISGLLITLSFMALGTGGYAWLEGFSILDAFYMTVITITTVGYGEVHTLSEAGRMFTIFLILFGFGSIGFLAHAFTEAIVEKATSRNSRKKTMEKKIAQLKGHVIICGYGRVGASAAEHFASTRSDFVVIETSEDQIKLIEEKNYNYLEGDATREEVLLSAGIKRAASLVALLDSDPENLFTVLTARELNPTLHIIARTEITTSESRMLRAGADSIISPYAAAGRSVAEKVLATTSDRLKKAVDLSLNDSESSWVNVTEESDLAGHVAETAASFLSATIVGIRRNGRDILDPHHEEKIILGDELLVIRPRRNIIERYHTVKKSQKIVLIDDNPVIRQLYTRLFQKAGFHLLTCANGKDGYDKILKERPDAAVIDFQLPDISGLDICRQLRGKSELSAMKIFLFTAEDNAETRKEALQAGIDTVVIKSPDAKEIVNTVKVCLESRDS